ncbi:MAG: maleylpyruvate isomerase family mycothiol-dependent enzyme [Actinomycetia bacterium]|nr:maleylpyruvate isomerase family mycothiol-dependent enzyme [Actinomycetes bacterium]
MEVEDYIGYVASEGELFASAAEQGQLGADVPACPGWDMRELVRHLGFIHLWAAGHVAFPHPEPDDAEELDDLAEYWSDLAGSWPEDAELVRWYRDTNANLVRVLEAAPADLECFTFLPAPSPLAMWARRQASETAIHRFDAENARGIVTRFDPALAADALDEMLCGFAPRPRELAITADQLIQVHAEDTDEHWYLTIEPEKITTSRHGGDADLTLSGTAAALYLLLWNRATDSNVAMSGDRDLMDLWHDNVQIRWS